MISNKKFFKSIFIAFLALSFTVSSCKKDDDDDDDDDNDATTFSLLEGTSVVMNNKTFTFSAVDNAANLHLKIKNNSTSAINMRVKLVSMTNSDGSNFQTCVGASCYNSVTVGGLYPDADFTIAAGATENTVTFWNKNATGDTPKTFNFKVYQVGGAAESINFTYKYQP